MLAQPVEERDPAATAMFREAAQSAIAVECMLAANRSALSRLGSRLRTLEPRAVVTCARGSSDNAATYARHLIETRLGVLSSSAALSVGSVYGTGPSLTGSLYVAISQSGMSPDLLASVKQAKLNGAFTVAFVNEVDSPLAELADEVFALSAGKEHSVAATKSCIVSFAALALLVAAWAGDASLAEAIDALPETLAQAWALDWNVASDLLADSVNLYTLGRGPGLGVAQETALKLKETCGIHAEAISTAEVLHGPMALAKPGFRSLVFAQNDAARAGTLAMAQSLVDRGAAVLIAGADLAGAQALPFIATHAAIEPILMLQ
ncbi:MAG TPA: SIS domain-containing protein, partial [Devosia sp.]|nr:SIS domain-containing protein [Devosia sp.]